ncbi:MAG: T9SS type B sorting domain-containing protein, partial [Segetibacter sp.]
DCDSLVTAHITISTIVTSEFSITACKDYKLPWDSTVNKTGDYIHIYKNINGCDSLVTARITINNTVTMATTVKACKNFFWNGKTYNTSGVYTFKTTTLKGCDSTITLNLTINATDTSNTKETICPAQLPHRWNGLAYNAAGTYTSTLTNSLGCDSIAILILTVNNAITTSQNISTCATSLTLPNGTVVTVSGVYTSILKTRAGCDSIITTNVAILSAPHLVTNNQSVCSQNLTDLTAAAVTAGSEAGLNYTYWTDNAATIVVRNPTAVSEGTYFIKATTIAGCYSIKAVVVSRIESPILIVTNPASVCFPATVNLKAIAITAGSSAGQTYTYWKESTGTVPLTNPDNVNISGTYYIQARGQSSCTTIMPVVVNVNPLPTAAISAGGTICAGAIIALDIAFTGTSPWTLTYSDNNKAYIINSITATPYQLVVSPAVNTTYSITSVTSKGCTNNAINSVSTITVIPTVKPVRYPVVTAIANIPIQLKARIFSNSTYKWNAAVGLNFTSIYNPIFKYDKETQYTISITSLAGCNVVDTQLVRIPIESDLYVPKAWSPNTDVHNDKLYPLTRNIKEIIYFRIFNRWGQLMFETNKLDDGWDGRFRGQNQVSDVYTWTVEAIGLDGKRYKKSGNSVLLR